MSVDPITCHILDTTLGTPASGVIVQLFHISNDPLLSSISEDTTTTNGKHFAMAKTDNDGRIKQWIINPNGDFQNLGINKNSSKNNHQSWNNLKPGIYKAKFLTGKYFLLLAQNQQGSTSGGGGGRTFFPFVEISFIIDNPPDNHYHIPLLLSNYSYTTYRGS